MNKKLLGASLVGAVSSLPLASFAVAPTWVSDAFTSAQTTLQDYLAAAAGPAAAVVIVMAGFFLVLKLIKKIAK